MPVIEVNHVTKEFRLGQLHNVRESISRLFNRFRGAPPAPRPRFKAIDDVSFTITPGEVVGIIGHNGAGKSTLLKLLAGITRPTHGQVSVRGRVAPLIEVGAGLVPDMTGRENIFLNASILGMRNIEIKQKFHDIVAFAELEEFIDTPVKRYSSGMQVRLGFAIATSVESEILIIDEVLAVGDLAFQRKCFDKMEQLIRREGRTVILVSHNLRQVVRICKRVLVVDHGRLLADELPANAADIFYAKADQSIQNAAESNRSKRGSHPVASHGVHVLSVHIEDQARRSIEEVPYLGGIAIVIAFESEVTLIQPVFAVGVDTTDLLHVAAERSERHLHVDSLPPGHHTLRCRIPRFPLTPGVYSIRVSVTDGASQVTRYYAENLAYFQVVSPRSERADLHGECFVQLSAAWELRDPCTSKSQHPVLENSA